MGDLYQMNTPNPEQKKENFKQFFDLNDEYYLKISTTEENELNFQCYNTKLLDLIECSEKMHLNKLQELSPKLKDYPKLIDLLGYIEILIDNKKYSFDKDGENLILKIIIDDKNIIPILLKKKIKESNDEFLQILSKEVIDFGSNDPECPTLLIFRIFLIKDASS